MICRGDKKTVPARDETTMPAIKARKQADGSTRYTAVVRIVRQGQVLHQRLFDALVENRLSGFR